MFYQYESIGKRKTMLTAVTITTLLLAVLPVRASDWLPYYVFQEESMTAQPEYSGKIAGRIESLQSANGLMFAYIKNDKGETLGRVTEIIFDRNQGVVDCVVISSETAHHPVPWAVFEQRPDSITLNIEKSAFMQAPAVSSIDIQQLAARDFRENIDNFYLTHIPDAHISKAAEKPDLCKLRDLKGLEINDLKGEKLGVLRNLVIDTRRGDIAYGLVGFGGLLRVGENTAAVPWASLMIQPDRKTARIDATRQTLDSAVISAANLDKLVQPQFARQVHQNFKTEPYWEVLGYVGPEEKQGLMTAWQADSRYNKCFNPAAITTIEGTIKLVEEFTPEYGAAPGINLNIETKKDEIVNVHLGPRDYISRMGFEFKPGTMVKITGSKAKVDEKDVIMATSVKLGGKTLVLRDEKGTPKW